MGKYAHSGPTEAIIDVLKEHAGETLSIPQITRIVLSEGLQTTSNNPGNMIRGVTTRLSKTGRVTATRDNGTTVYGIKG